MASTPEDAQVDLEELFLQRAAQGSRWAFVALSSMHFEKLFSIARNLSSSEPEAVELAEAALQRAWDRIRALPPQLSFRTFVSRFLVQEAVQRLQEPAAAAGGSAARFPPFEVDDWLVTMRWGSGDMEGLARRPDLADRLREALEALDPLDRAAFVLRIVEDFSPQETAAILDIPETIATRRVYEASLLMTGCIQRLLAQSGTLPSGERSAFVQ